MGAVMGNDDIEIGQQFLRRTYHGLAALLAEAHEAREEQVALVRRTPFKLYRDVPRVDLDQELPLELGDLRAAFPAFAHLRPAPPQLDRPTLSRLLFYSYGFSRHDAGTAAEWPHHRVVPSARCLFPSELYVFLPEDGELLGGLYHYDVPHHRLDRLRGAEAGPLLWACLGERQDDARAVLLVSSLFWKTAAYYANFAYRLCTQEAGMVAGNALMVAGALGLRGQIRYQFLDRPLNRLLGLAAGEESTLAVLPLFAGEPAPARRLAPTAAEDLLAQIAPIQPATLGSAALDPQRCGLLLEIDRHSMLEDSAAIRRGLAFAPPHWSGSPALHPPAPAALPVDLAGALHARSSGDMFFRPDARPIPAAVFWEILRHALAPYSSDVQPEGAPPLLQLYVVVNHVGGVAPGVYRLDPQNGALASVAAGPQVERLRAVQSGMDCGAAAMVCYLAGDYVAVSAALRNRSYRILHAESGLVAQRLCLLGAAYGLAARCSDSYSLDATVALLRLEDSPLLPLFQIALGYERPGAGAGERYRLSIRF
ncbi:MAG: SagB family peptide dehydrogenase [Roseiflexaceae bacterium]